MRKSMSDEIKCRISAPNRHLFQNTAKFYGRGVSRCCRPSAFLVTFELEYLSCYIMQTCEIFCRLSLLFNQDMQLALLYLT